MSATVDDSTANEFIESLQQQVGFQQNKITTLVIAHNDRELITALSAGLEAEETAVLAVPQCSWQFDQTDLSAAVEWAIAQGCVERLIIAGHSDPAADPAGDDVASQAITNVQSGRVSRLVEGCRETMLKHRAVEEGLIAQIQQLTDQLAMGDSHPGADVRLIGLLYRCETGFFSVYDDLKGEFQPLVEACG